MERVNSSFEMVRDKISGIFESFQTYFKGDKSETKVQFEEKLYDEIRKWAQEGLINERFGILLANRDKDAIYPTRFIDDKELTKKSTLRHCLPNNDEIAKHFVVGDGGENVTIIFHNHPIFDSNAQSGDDMYEILSGTN